MRRSRVVPALLVAGALLVPGCSSASGAHGATSAPATRLATALQRIDPAAVGDEFEFGDTTAIAALVTQDPAWKAQVGIGAGMAGAADPPVEQALGIDIARSDLLLTVGSPRQSLTLVIGGQDAAAITAAAKGFGWAGSGTLKRAPGGTDTPTDMALSANQVRPLGHDVAFGEQHADVAGIDDGAAAIRQPGYAALADCLGEVVAARFGPVQQVAAPGAAASSAAAPSATGAGATASRATVSEAATGVRAVPHSARTTSVICLVTEPGRADQLIAATKAALADGSSFQNRRKWSNLLPSAQVDAVAGPNPIVRITADTDSQQAAEVLLLLATGDLPGANGPGT